MAIRLYPGWLVDELLIVGAEGDDPNTDPDGDSGDPNNQEEENSEGSQGNEDDDNEDEPDADDPNKELKIALNKERRRAKALERENKAFKRTQEEASLKDASELEKANAKAAKLEEKTTKLAQGLLNRDLNAAIEKAARDAKFIDVSDALAGVDRSQLAYEQDDDDPTDITIDLRSITNEVKKLAQKKPHFIRSGTDDDQPTGSQFGGKPQKKITTEDQLKAAYPAL